ncbi:hypothetical protein SAMN04488059_1393 [Devosia psychrophila]|uniref:Uncharacterized protein n=1 Tax=Devosia psychrophila TaxID=728005 RepID=A0A1I1R9D2_9HYPH|nr:hypothetical protein SAMN04488059_1393 [Devosia psychrophila]
MALVGAEITLILAAPCEAHMHDARDYAPVINPRHSSRVRRRQRRQPPEVFLAQPKLTRYVRLLGQWTG